MTATPTRPAEPGPPPSRSRRERVAVAVLLLGTAALYLVNLSVNGWANEFYAGAVQAMTRSGEAFFFGASDAGGTVTVDKPPAALWVMAASAEVFGLSSWSVLVPQALMGVATVALLYAAVRRAAGPGAALVAGTVMALTPVAVLMFRFDNPDALLVLLLVAAACAVVRALEHAGTRWLLLAGVLVGLAFLTKTAQAFLPLPAMALAYLVAAPAAPWRRVRQLLAAGAAMVVAGGWWFVVVDLWPAQDRPYIGGSTTNSAIELAIGYNGLGRILGAGDGTMTVPAGGFGPFGGSAGPGRLFTTEVGGQVAWLLPAALVLAAVALWLTRRAPRTDPTRASLLLWGGWTLVTGLVLSFMSGIFHEYYTVALAPGVAALVGIGGAELWRRRSAPAARIVLAAVVAGSAAWAVVLLARTPEFVPWAPYAVIALGAVAVVALLLGARTARAGTAGLLAAALALSVGPAAYALDTVGSARTGAIPLAGPAEAGFGGGPGGGASPAGGPDGSAPPAGGADGGVPGIGGPGGGAPGSGGPGPGGAVPGAAVATDPELAAALRSAGTRWSAATVTATAAARLALDSGTDVMGIGGFSGSDPAPTLEQFQAAVAAGEVRWFVVDGGPGGFGPGANGAAPDPQQLLAQAPAAVRSSPQFAQFEQMLEEGELPGGFGGGGTGTEITTWVEENFTELTIGGRTVHDLSSPRS